MHKTMTKPELIEIMGAYSLDLEFEKPAERKLRFRSSLTFVDAWLRTDGSLTIGLYLPKKSFMSFHRDVRDAKLEDLLMSLKK